MICNRRRLLATTYDFVVDANINMNYVNGNHFDKDFNDEAKRKGYSFRIEVNEEEEEESEEIYEKLWFQISCGAGIIILLLLCIICCKCCKKEEEEQQPAQPQVQIQHHRHQPNIQQQPSVPYYPELARPERVDIVVMEPRQTHEGYQ